MSRVIKLTAIKPGIVRLQGNAPQPVEITYLIKRGMRTGMMTAPTYAKDR